MSGNASAVVRRARRKRLAAAFAGLAALALAGCGRTGVDEDRVEPRFDVAGLDAAMHILSGRARPGVLGAAVQDLETGETWAYNGDRRFPLASLASLPIAAATLAEHDAGRLDLGQTIELAGQDLSPPPSPIAQAWPARRAYPLDALLAAALEGDATAADVVVKRIGGPGAVGGWLQGRRVEGIRVDRYARQIGCEMSGLGSFRADWAGEAAFTAVLDAVPAAERRAAQAEYLLDPADTATPRGMLDFLRQLSAGELLEPASTRRLLALMNRPGAAPDRLQPAFPPGTRVARVTGAARPDLGVQPAANEAAIVSQPGGRRYAVAVFLAGSALPGPARDALFADVGKAIARGVD